MKLSKILLFAGLVVILVLLAPGSQTRAGNPPNGTPAIGGPEIWATVIIDCADNTVSLRTKFVDNCVVYTQALVENYGTALCSDQSGPIELTANDLLHQWIHGPVYDQSGTPIQFEDNDSPIVTKVKNFKKDTDDTFHTGFVYSADVLIRFCSTGCP